MAKVITEISGTPANDQERKAIDWINNIQRHHAQICAVAHMPSHANILAVKALFVSDEEDCVVLVTAANLPGQALRQHIKKSALALTFDSGSTKTAVCRSKVSPETQLS